MFSHSYNRATRYIALAALVSFMTPATVLAGEIAAGKDIYSTTCIACHGANGKGMIPGVSDLTKADGPLAKSDAQLSKSIAEGVTTPGAALTMPANGGYPSLTDSQVASLIAYLRSEFAD